MFGGCVLVELGDAVEGVRPARVLRIKASMRWPGERRQCRGSQETMESITFAISNCCAMCRSNGRAPTIRLSKATLTAGYARR